MNAVHHGLLSFDGLSAVGDLGQIRLGVAGALEDSVLRVLARTGGSIERIQFHQLLANGAGDIIQPEIQWAGGLTEVRRIAQMAKPHNLPVVPHGASVYNYHFVISHTNAPYAEYLTVSDGREIRPKFDAIEGEPLPEDGEIRLSEAPGFGVELNRDILDPFRGVGAR